MKVKFGKVHRTLAPNRPNMNDFSVVTVDSPLQLFDTVTFGKCDAEFALDHGIGTEHCYRLRVDEDDDQLVEAFPGIDPADKALKVDICRDKATVQEDATALVVAVARDLTTTKASSIEQAIGYIRARHIAPVQMIQCELGDGSIVCTKSGNFMMPCCGAYRGFVCLDVNDVCVVRLPLVGS